MNAYAKMPQQQHKKPINETTNKVQEATAAETSPSYLRRHKAILFQMGVLLLIILFALLTLQVRKTAYFLIDLQVTLAIQSISNPLYSGVLNVISWAGNSPQAFLIPTLIVMLLLACGGRLSQHCWPRY
jgi:hypothetical protein